MSPLPLFKLGALLAKQIAKPLGKILKDKAKQSQTFKNWFIIPSANLYHNIDITIRMRMLGLGSPDKVPALTEKAAIELGGDILSEFFVFGTAVVLLVVEYMRQSSNTVKKEHALTQKVSDLETEQKELVNKLDKTNNRISELNQFLADQRIKMDDLNTKYSKLDSRRNLKFASQASQTDNGAIYGRVMYAKNSQINPSADVTNSIMYQVAHSAVDRLKNIVNISLLTLEIEEQLPVMPSAVPVKEAHKPTTKLTAKQASPSSFTTSSKTTDKLTLTSAKK